MPDTNTHITDYSQTITQRVEKGLLDIWGRLGEYRDFLVVIGGLVPRYITTPEGSSDYNATTHCGTMDIDFGISLAVSNDEKYKDISMPAVRKYNEYCAGVGISKDMYFDAWSTINDIHGEDYDGDGKNDAYSAMDKKLSYIDSLSISSSQKTALALANGISETQINNRAPW